MKMTVVMAAPGHREQGFSCSNNHVSISQTKRSLHRIYLYSYWTFVSLAFVSLFVAFNSLASSDYSDMALLVSAVVALVTVTCAAIAYVLFLRQEARRWQYRWWSVALLGVVATYGVGLWQSEIFFEWIALATFVSVGPVLWARVGRRAYVVLATTVVGTGATYVAYELGATYSASIVIAALAIPFVAWSFWVQWWQYDVALQLEEARQVAAQLAIADERLRFAAELHDIQGHHLQAITLKAELAARLAESEERADAAEYREIEQLARHALRDTREVVTGYRKVSLESEIDNAAQLFRAVDIDVSVVGAESVVDPSDGLLGYLVREASTNILRHSQATWVSIRVSKGAREVTVSITNDGAGSGPIVAGNGLSMLAERFSGADGSLSWELYEQRMQLSGSVGSGVNA